MGPFAFRLFGPSRSERDAEQLYLTVLAVVRRSGFYGPDRTPDTFDGRFELITAVAGLAMMRLKAAPETGRLGQDFADRLFLGLDDALREAGVGDLSVPKKMKALARRVYGRVQAYADALADPDPAALAAALARNVWNTDAPPYAPALAGWMRATAAAFATAAPTALLDADSWPPPPV